MDRERRRELREVYRMRPSDAGVYLLRNTATGRILIGSSQNLAAFENRLAFGKQSGSIGVLDQRMAADARTHGMTVIEFEVLDRLETRPEATAAEAAAELAQLEALWREKLANVPHY